MRRLTHYVLVSWVAVCCVTAGAAVAAQQKPPRSSKTPTTKERSTYYYEDDKGKYYGDRVPIDASTRERKVLNRQGVVVQTLEAEKTPAELAAEQERMRIAAEQKQHDVFLLTTYASVREIEQLRDQRLDQIEGQVLASSLYIETLEQRLQALQARALTFRPYNADRNAQRLPDDLAENLVRTLKETRVQRNALESKRKEKDTVRDEFESDIQRFRTLKVAQIDR